MVMMDKNEKPSPNQVGREFVRQYYTLLNKAPELLHRFFSTSSSYVHGEKYCDGEPEKPVIGQAEIHRKISSLKFHECHTKIRQVDAHSTVGDGVVIQVTGELSNNREPLRRFMQTFVLAPQGDNPFKFYVHNDIFRYQDEVFHDATQNEHGEDEDQVVEETLEQQPAESNQAPEFEEDYYQQAEVDEVAEAQPSVLTNGIEQANDEPAMDERQDSPSLEVQEDDPETVSPVESPIPDVEDAALVNNDDVAAEEEPVKEQENADKEEVVEAKQPAKPFSWAHLASKNTPPASATAQKGTVVKVNRSPSNQAEPASADAGETGSRPARAPRNNQRPPPREDDRFFERQERRGPTGGGSGIRYPDNQQIFVGNLPYDMAESDLREHFRDFGPVLEVRINHSHSNNPNFGFVIFEDQKSVDNVLSVMPTHYKGGYRINIEEKKQRNNNREGNRRPGDPRRGGMGDGNRGGRRMPQPMRRDRQGSRERIRSNYNNPPRR